MQQQRGGGNAGTWIGFLAMAFVVVGLAGIFGTYAAQLPLQRELARQATLDQAAALAAQPDQTAALDALRPALGDSAAAILDAKGPGDLGRRIAAERVAVRAQFSAEADDDALRLRILIAVVTLAGALFGAAVVSITTKTS